MSDPDLLPDFLATDDEQPLPSLRRSVESTTEEEEDGQQQNMRRRRRKRRRRSRIRGGGGGAQGSGGEGAAGVGKEQGGRSCVGCRRDRANRSGGQRKKKRARGGAGAEDSYAERPDDTLRPAVGRRIDSRSSGEDSYAERPDNTLRPAVRRRIDSRSSGHEACSDGAETQEDLRQEDLGSRLSTLNFIFAQFVLSHEMKELDFYWLMDRTPAVLVMVICDPEGDQTSRLNWMQRYLRKRGDMSVGWAAGPICSSGGLFYKKSRVSAVADCGDGPLEDVTTGSWVYQAYNVDLHGDYYNPPVTIAVAGVFMKLGCGDGLWGTRFNDLMKRRIKSEKIRFLCGVFPKTNDQLEDIARSCGASHKFPLHQVWKRAQKWVTHTAYIIPFGRCTKVSVPPWVEQHQTMPWWLAKVRTEIDVDDLPVFRSRGVSASMPDLGHVKQKPVDLQHWVPHIHQLIVWVGTARQGQGARRQDELRRRRQSEWSMWGGYGGSSGSGGWTKSSWRAVD